MQSSRFWYVEYTNNKTVVFAFPFEKNEKEFDEYIKKHYNIKTFKKWCVWTY